jgi:four helix bundle protein
MVDFALQVIGLTKQAPRSRENKVIADQLIRSSSSIGANYADANNAASKLDFRNKIFIAKKEAAESRYWLQLFAKVNPSLMVNPLIDEVTQLLLILQKIITTLKNGK